MLGTHTHTHAKPGRPGSLSHSHSVILGSAFRSLVPVSGLLGRQKMARLLSAVSGEATRAAALLALVSRPTSHVHANKKVWC